MKQKLLSRVHPRLMFAHSLRSLASVHCKNLTALHSVQPHQIERSGMEMASSGLKPFGIHKWILDTIFTCTAEVSLDPVGFSLRLADGLQSTRCSINSKTSPGEYRIHTRRTPYNLECRLIALSPASFELTWCHTGTVVDLRSSTSNSASGGIGVPPKRI